MGVPSYRDSLRNGEFDLVGKDGKTRQFSTYKSIQDGINDMLIYLEYMNYPKNETSLPMFVLYMKGKGYFEEDYAEYLHGVTGYYAKLI